MPIELVDDKVIIDDEKLGNQLHNKGYYGTPLSGGGLELDLYEALYLLEVGRLDHVQNEEGEPVLKKEIRRRARNQGLRISVNYPLYRDMRKRGFVLKKANDPADFRVFPRGGGPGKTPSKYWLIGVSENDNFDVAEIEETYNKIFNIKKEMMIGLVDEERDVTYYNLSTFVLKGEIKNELDIEAIGTIIGDRCYINKGAKELHETAFYGQYEEDGEELSISLYEALYLLEKGMIKIKDSNDNEILDVDDLINISPDYEDFTTKYSVYKDLRDRGVIPKTGFKYGSTFRCYVGDPDDHHAEYMVHPVSKDFKVSWYNVSRAVRVSHTVKKDFIYARDKDGDITYIKISRETP